MRPGCAPSYVASPNSSHTVRQTVANHNGAIERTSANHNPWSSTLALFPGLAISIAVLAFNLLGGLLRDILHPRLRR